MSALPGLALPLFGAFAHHSRGRESLTPDHLQPWVAPWIERADPDDWFLDRQAGFALLRPEATVSAPGPLAALAVRGSLRAAPMGPEPPMGWPVPAAEDTATALLYRLLDHGEDAFGELAGDFSLAFWDGHRRRLLLTRDALGQRSLYFRRAGGLTVFCSEPEPLLRAPGLGVELAAESAFWYLAFGTPPPGRTLAQGVDVLPAAHLLRWCPGAPALERRWWTPLDPESPVEATEEVIGEIRRTLDTALLSAVADPEPWGLLLSGGVDSSYLAACAVVHSRAPEVALTSAFEERHGLNETDYAAAVAGWLRVQHRPVTLAAAEGLELLREVVLAAPIPCAAWAALTHHRVLAEARSLGVERLVSGLGADEIFGGYDHFRGYYARFLRFLRRQPVPAGLAEIDLPLLAEEQSSRRVLYPGVARFFDDPSLRRGLEEPYRRWQYASHLRAFYRECRRLKPEAHAMELMVAHECQQRIPEILFGNFEPLARAHGVEVRYPFLEPGLVRLVAGLRVEDRYRNSRGEFSLRWRDLQPRFKHAMLEVARGRVPEEVVERPRKSFTAPFGGWLFDPAFGPAVIDDLRRSPFWRLGIVRKEWLEHILERIEPGPNPWVFQLWALVTLAGWYERFAEPN